MILKRYIWCQTKQHRSARRFWGSDPSAQNGPYPGKSGENPRCAATVMHRKVISQTAWIISSKHSPTQGPVRFA